MNRLAYLSARVFNTPLAIHPQKAEVIMAALAERLGVVSLENFAPRPMMFEGEEMFEDPAKEEYSAYEIIKGAAIIPIHGTLVNKLGSLHPYSGMTGYDGIRQNFLMAMNDPEVKGIAFDIESPGGECAGCFDLGDLIYSYRGVKPMVSILSEYAYSAAFCLASAADRVYIPRTGGVGSVGTICLHVDMSKALANAGLKVTMIHFGDRKIDGHAEIPLSKEAAERMQADIDDLGEMFIAAVSRNLRLDRERVLSTQAGCFMGAKAVEVGFAHKVLPPDEAFSEFVQSLQG